MKMFLLSSESGGKIKHLGYVEADDEHAAAEKLGSTIVGPLYGLPYPLSWSLKESDPGTRWHLHEIPPLQEAPIQMRTRRQP